MKKCKPELFGLLLELLSASAYLVLILGTAAILLR